MPLSASEKASRKARAKISRKIAEGCEYKLYNGQCAPPPVRNLLYTQRVARVRNQGYVGKDGHFRIQYRNGRGRVVSRKLSFAEYELAKTMDLPKARPIEPIIVERKAMGARTIQLPAMPARTVNRKAQDAYSYTLEREGRALPSKRQSLFGSFTTDMPMPQAGALPILGKRRGSEAPI
ncbi:MAG: hypothetical protein GY845_35395 [Planctomycetes bacterium]|nr:hypothetical protein [Planctomycetota bacterium]